MLTWSRRLWIGAALAAPLVVLLRDGDGNFGPVRLLLAQVLLFVAAAATGARGARARWAGTGVLAWGVAALLGAGAGAFAIMLADAPTPSYAPARALSAVCLMGMAAVASAVPAKLSRAEPGDPTGSRAFGAALAGVGVLAACSGPLFPLGALVRGVGPLQIAAALSAAGCAALPAILVLRPRFTPVEGILAAASQDLGAGRFVMGGIAMLAAAALAAFAPTFVDSSRPAMSCPPGEVLLGSGPWARCGTPGYGGRLNAP